jgi:hypothetical protein
MPIKSYYSEKNMLITPCKDMAGVMVGSEKCRKCVFMLSTDRRSRAVACTIGISTLNCRGCKMNKVCTYQFLSDDCKKAQILYNQREGR